jgi:hypothetical protein
MAGCLQCCNLATWRISVLQLSYFVPFLRQKSLAGYNHHPSQQPTLSLSAPDSASTSPCTTYYYPFLASCSWACSPARPVVHSPQLLLLLLSCSLPSLHPLSMSTWCGAYWIGASHSVSVAWHGGACDTWKAQRGPFVGTHFCSNHDSKSWHNISISGTTTINNERQLDNG